MKTLKCKICGKQWKHLGSHIWHKHQILAREYKEEYGLPYDMSLTTTEIQEKKRIAEKENSTWKKNLLSPKALKNRFKKGRTGQRRISEHERKVIIERIKKVNKNRKANNCPVCNIIFKNTDSHLYNAHKLINVKNL